MIINNSSSLENGNEEADFNQELRGLGLNSFGYQINGLSLNMPMGLPDNQMQNLNPNNRAVEQYNSTGVQSSRTTSRNSSV